MQIDDNTITTAFGSIAAAIAALALYVVSLHRKLNYALVRLGLSESLAENVAACPVVDCPHRAQAKKLGRRLDAPMPD